MYLVSNENLPCGKMISDSLPKMSKKDILKNFHLCFSFHITAFLHFLKKKKKNCILQSKESQLTRPSMLCS